MEAYSRAESEGEFSDWKGKWVAVTGTIIHGPFDAATSAYREGSKHSPDVYVSRIE